MSLRYRQVTRRREVAYYHADECILVDGEHLIRSLPAKILWKLLNARQTEGARSSRTASCGSRGRFALELGCDVALVQRP